MVLFFFVPAEGEQKRLQHCSSEKNKIMDKLKITIFADPVCTWCWGTAPVTRAIEQCYGDRVIMNYVMVKMVDDIRTFSERRLQIGGDDIPLSNRNMANAWLDASKIHGMPVETKGFRLFDEEHRSTAPQCTAYIAAEMFCEKRESGPQKAHRYLRAVQQATAAEAVRTCLPATLADIAATVGIEPEYMRTAMESEEARLRLARGEQLAAHYEVQSTPSFLLEYKGKELLVQGYTPFEALGEAIAKLTGGSIKPEKQAAQETINEKVARYVARHGSVYPVEIATAFALGRRSGHTALNIESYEHLPDIIEQLLSEEKIAITPFANSFKIYSVGEERTLTQKREREYARTM